MKIRESFITQEKGRCNAQMTAPETFESVVSIPNFCTVPITGTPARM